MSQVISSPKSNQKRQGFKARRKKLNKANNRDSRLTQYGKKIEKNLPESEKWFRAKWLELFSQVEPITLYQDQFNTPLGKYIPDVINNGYKYIIEIDGSIHKDEIVAFKDRLKTDYYLKRKYTVYRIEAYNEEQFETVYKAVLELKQNTPRRY